MQIKIKTLQLVPVILLCVTWQVQADETPDLANNTKVLVTEQQIKDAPIVIQTQARDYDEPNLDEYKQCNENRETCLKVCDSSTDKEKCEDECPQCPILISHDVAVQGVNDTAFRFPNEKPTNATNVIKLTNHIYNVIETSHNITANNENRVVVHQNISNVGGKYGFGYSDKGPCCMVLRQSSSCRSGNNNSRSRRSICLQKRHRLCSNKNCRASVMYAKPIHHCVLDDDGKQQCDDKIKFHYTPYKFTQRAKCSYIPRWPYVWCGEHQENVKTNICQRCMRITYGEILQNGVPPPCQHCFLSSSHTKPIASTWYPSYPYYAPQIYENSYFPALDDSWNVEKSKCRYPDGTITDCDSDLSIINNFDNYEETYGDDNKNMLNNISDLDYDNYSVDINSKYASSDIDDENNEYLRRRRQLDRIFKPSKYSLRHRDEI